MIIFFLFFFEKKQKQSIITSFMTTFALNMKPTIIEDEIWIRAIWKSAISEQSEDFENLINAARKAVEHGYLVYILPNPKGIRTADFIFERKGVYKIKEPHEVTLCS